jgi:hypothetical protein
VKCLTPTLAKNWFILAEMKEGPLSVIIYNGGPNLENMLFSRKEITLSFVECLSGTNSTHFVKLYVVVKIKTCPAEYGGLIGPIKYNPHFEKGKCGRTCCNSMDERHSFPEIFLHLSQYLEKT